jgi:cellulose biosynthesis protein BcsQ
MALANIAFELAKRNKKVLIVDWDLEAPGLENYFSSLKIENSGEGLLQLLLKLQENSNPNYKDYLTTISSNLITPISLLQSGRNNDHQKYSALLDSFNWNNFFGTHKGAVHLENLREKWLEDYDHVLIDSRTGLSDSSGVCTIMMPDILIPMFTANYQSLFGIRDVIKYIQVSRQSLSFQRMALTILPIPSRFGSRVEFKESQEWLDRIADLLKDCFNVWLPKWIEPRFILEQVKIPQIDYFSFGEKLAVLEQGTSDPEGMGYIYSKIASLLSSEFSEIQSFVGDEIYQTKKDEYLKNNSESIVLQSNDYKYDVFISSPKFAYQWVKELLIPSLNEYLYDKLDGIQPSIFFEVIEQNIDETISLNLKNSLQKSKTLLFIFSNSDVNINTNYINYELNYFIEKEKSTDSNLIFPITFNTSDVSSVSLPDILKGKEILDYSVFKYEETLKSTKLRVQFGQEIERLAYNIAEAIKFNKSSENNSSNNKRGIFEQSERKINELLVLAKEYDEIRIKLPSGNNRTTLMTNIVKKMKNMVIDQSVVFPRFIESESRGERLIVISQLQKNPNVKYIDWLAIHVGDSEKPFIGYNASIALYAATQKLSAKFNEEISNALKKADKNLKKSTFQDPNQISILEAANLELKLNSNTQ